MYPFFSVYLLLLVPLISYSTTILFNHCILRGYKRAGSELEFPAEVTAQAAKTRRIRLILGTLAAYSAALWAASSWTMLCIYIIYMGILTAIIVMDFEQQIILNNFILALVLLAILATPVLPIALLPRILAGAGSFFLFLLIAIITRGGIGGGDIKLIGALGVFLGMDRIIFTIICGIIAGGLVSLFLLVTKKKKRKDTIAYGPYFAVSAMISLLM